MKRIFICSPWRGDTQRNKLVAQCLCMRALARRHAPFAPHLIFPQLLDDDIKEERDLGLACATAGLLGCHELWHWPLKENASEGMLTEIALADVADIPSFYVEPLADHTARHASEVMELADCPDGDLLRYWFGSSGARFKSCAAIPETVRSLREAYNGEAAFSLMLEPGWESVALTVTVLEGRDCDGTYERWRDSYGPRPPLVSVVVEA